MRRVALFAIILTVGSCVIMAEEALPTQWDLTEIYENMDAWQADDERAIEMIPQYESYQGTLNTVQGLYGYLPFAHRHHSFRRQSGLLPCHPHRRRQRQSRCFKNHRPR